VEPKSKDDYRHDLIWNRPPISFQVKISVIGSKVRLTHWLRGTYVATWNYKLEITAKNRDAYASLNSKLDACARTVALLRHSTWTRVVIINFQSGTNHVQYFLRADLHPNWPISNLENAVSCTSMRGNASLSRFMHVLFIKWDRISPRASQTQKTICSFMHVCIAIRAVFYQLRGGSPS